MEARLRLVEIRKATSSEKAELKKAIEARNIQEISRIFKIEEPNIVTFEGVSDSLKEEDRSWMNVILQSSLLD